MRILLDENLNWRLRRDLPGHEVESVPLIGWAGIHNGALLRKAAENGFDVLVTMDGNIPYQQNIASQKLAVVALRATTNRLEDTRPLMAFAIGTASSIKGWYPYLLATLSCISGPLERRKATGSVTGHGDGVGIAALARRLATGASTAAF